MAIRHLVLVVLMILPGASAVVGAESFGDFLYTSDGSEITIVGYTGEGGDIIIPGSIDGLPVATIGEEAFFQRADLTSVIFPDSLTTIGRNAFAECGGLTSVALPMNLATLEFGAFVQCTAVEEFLVHPANTAFSSLDGVLFDKPPRKLIQYPAARAGSYAVPDGVETIGEYSFFFCMNLSDITMPDSLTEIEDGAFAACIGLENVAIGRNVTTIGHEAFAVCIILPHVTIPDKVVTIGDLAFAMCSWLHSVQLGASVVTIGAEAFFYCRRLGRIYIPPSVTMIKEGAFSGCWNLTSYYFGGDAPDYEDYIFDYSAYATAYYLPGTDGWGSTYAGRPAVLWNPTFQEFDVLNGQLSCIVTGTPGIPIAVEVSDHPVLDSWSQVHSGVLHGGAIPVNLGPSSNTSSRVYRVVAP